ncbi:GIY-YIG nuclease family protein [Olivibacter sitiensis]|uniref:GIY-YIG nuclease family protein n=1 Tax=Olivibacter sitiensis TaxID=376470 RepID=UPI001FE036AA|nr:GIY-YIG nuclease family protein [Olivibacter sitiensis]
MNESLIIVGYIVKNELDELEKMKRGGIVYIITNKSHRVLYTGVTSDLLSRIKKHRDKEFPNSFSARYNVYKLVYYRFFSTIQEAIAEEKRIKGGNRKQKLRLIEGLNPDWNDLWDEIVEW